MRSRPFVPLHRNGKGDYFTHDERWRIIFGWGDETLRLWTVHRIEGVGVGELIGEWRTLRDARAQIENIVRTEARLRGAA